MNNEMTIVSEVHDERKEDVLKLQIILQDDRLICHDNQDGEHTTSIDIHIDRNIVDLLQAIDQWLSKDEKRQELSYQFEYSIWHQNEMINEDLSLRQLTTSIRSDSKFYIRFNQPVYEDEQASHTHAVDQNSSQQVEEF